MAQPTGLYGWIESNDGRSAGLFCGFLLAVQVLVAVLLILPLALLDIGHSPLNSPLGYLARYAPLVLIASAVWFGLQMLWHIETVKKAVGFHFVDSRDEARLCRVIEPLIIAMGLPVPFVGVIESRARNAFACGVGHKKAVVVVTRGLLHALDEEELAAVLAHELSHIKHGDIRLMAAANVLLGGLATMQRYNPMRFTIFHMVAAVVVPAVLPIVLVAGFVSHLALRAGQVLRLLIASSREFIADAEAADLTRNPAALASALIKVEHDYRVETARDEDDAMMIAGDSDGEGATHPTVAQRIAALARTTGSMVFNAPHSPSRIFGRAGTSLEEAEAAALNRRLPPTRALARVRRASNTNWLGLDPLGTWALAGTTVLLVLLNWGSIHDLPSLLALFAPRHMHFC